MRRCCLLLGLLLAAMPVRAADDVTIKPDVVYGHKDGLAMTFDVLSPPNANGAGVLWLQSGGWYSGWADPKALVPASKQFLDKGITMFIVRHGSAPKYAIPDAVADVRRCVRYIRGHAAEWNVDPERLGVTGGSAGGHLTLMLATTGDDGDPNAKDEVLKSSSRIAAAVALFPPTDIRTWVTDPPAEIKKHPGLKPPLTFDPALTPGLSPLLQVSTRTAPTLLIHGDKDELVPIEHSLQMIDALKKADVPSELINVEGAGHGFSPEQNRTIVGPGMVNWFVKYLKIEEGK